VYKKLITNFQPFVEKMKKCQVPWGGGLTHTVDVKQRSDLK